jgi:cellulose synthase/poly-beta-1,6-N-acetylglucosamine synthase-like glycosyltransferase
VTVELAFRTVFWLSTAVVTFVYFGYPVLLRLGLFGLRKPFDRVPIPTQPPMVSVIIAARNEESGIEGKLRNLLSSSYPREQLEILVGSDGSSDRTEEIVRPLATEGVGLISFPMHQGKSAVQNRLVAVASGSILVFTDADCLVSRSAISDIVENFSDPTVGLVTGCPSYVNRSETSVTENEGMYLRYETWLREQESARGLLAVASGSFFALRRSLWKPLDAHLGDDFVLPLKVIESGFRNVLDSRVVAQTQLLQSNPDAMLRLKIRIVSKDFRALLAQTSLLNPFANGRIAVALGSHKLLRWFVPYFLIAIFMTTSLLSVHPAFRAMTGLQIAFYAAAIVGLVFPRQRLHAAWSIPASFCLVNFASLLGTLKCLAGRTSGRWEPKRTRAALARPRPVENTTLSREPE